MKNLPGGVCFDFNGVIVDDERHHCEALITTLAQHDVHLDEQRFYREYLGSDDRSCFERGFREAGRTLETDLFNTLLTMKAARYRELLSNDLTLVPGVTDFIVSLMHRESPLAVVSAAPREEIEFVLRHAGLDECFTTIIASEDVTSRKPHPEPYLQALNLLGLSARKCIAIEDSLVGCASAQAAGIPVLMLTTSFDRDRIEEVGPAAIWEDFFGRVAGELPWNP